jgi:hypothetical protein
MHDPMHLTGIHAFHDQGARQPVRMSVDFRRFTDEFRSMLSRTANDLKSCQGASKAAVSSPLRAERITSVSCK